MLTIQEILRRKGERRSIGRTSIQRNALMFFGERVGVNSCTVRDVTNQGAGIRLHQTQILPIDFHISFDNLRTTRECRLIWRQDDFAGIAFLS